jgi:hypothetical protein
MDVVLTMRLHGLALALKNGPPAVAVDPFSGGDKITAQARAVDWPCAFAVDKASEDVMDDALRFALSAEGGRGLERLPNAGNGLSRLFEESSWAHSRESLDRRDAPPMVDLRSSGS